MSIQTGLLDQREIEQLEKFAFILKTIAHPLRFGIVRLLDENDSLSVSEICKHLGTEQSLTSHHLQNMKLKGILGSVRDGRNIFYFLKEKDVSQIIACLEKCNFD